MALKMAVWSSISLLLILPVVLGSSDPASAAVDDYDVLQYINPLIGSANGGMSRQLFPNTLSFERRSDSVN